MVRLGCNVIQYRQARDHLTHLTGVSDQRLPCRLEGCPLQWTTRLVPPDGSQPLHTHIQETVVKTPETHVASGSYRALGSLTLPASRRPKCPPAPTTGIPAQILFAFRSYLFYRLSL